MRAIVRKVDRSTWEHSRRAENIAYTMEQTDNRTFELIPEHSKNSAEHPLRIAVFGCQGSGNENQHAVAKLLNKFCANPATRPDFILVLGDNVYDYGAHFAGDPAITECFDDVYLKDYPAHNSIPFFLIQGNHDGGFQNNTAVKAGKSLNPRMQTGTAQSMHEVAHSYLPSTRVDPLRGKVIYSAQDKQDIYSSTSLNLADLPSWNMPRRYYSLIAGDVQIFCLDSSTYVAEYLQAALQTDDEQCNPLNNQALWLQQEVKKARAAGKKIIFAQHHPVHNAGKGAYHNDAGIYLTDRAIRQAQVLFDIAANSATPYSTFLAKTYQRQRICPDQVWNAHDHNINYYNNAEDEHAKHKFCQLTSGGGGGDLQERAHFTEQHNTGCFLKEYGLCLVSHSTGSPDFHYRIETVKGKNLEFNNHSAKSIIYYPKADPCDGPNSTSEAEKMQTFIDVIETAIRKYLANIGIEQHSTNGHALGTMREHGSPGIDRAHDVWAYIRAPYPTSFDDMVKAVEKMVNNYSPLLMGGPGPNSLISYINQETSTAYHKTIQQMAKECNDADITREYAHDMRVGI